MAGRLAGKVAVVTGAAPRGEGVGNGMATAIMFASAIVLPPTAAFWIRIVYASYFVSPTWVSA